MRRLTLLLFAALLGGCASDPDLPRVPELPVLGSETYPPPARTLALEPGRLLLLPIAGLNREDSAAMSLGLTRTFGRAQGWSTQTIDAPPGGLSRGTVTDRAAQAGARLVVFVEILEFRDYPPMRLTARVTGYDPAAAEPVYEALLPVDARMREIVGAARSFDAAAMTERDRKPGDIPRSLQVRSEFLEFCAHRIASAFLLHTKPPPLAVTRSEE